MYRCRLQSIPILFIKKTYTCACFDWQSNLTELWLVSAPVTTWLLCKNNAFTQNALFWHQLLPGCYAKTMHLPIMHSKSNWSLCVINLGTKAGSLTYDALRCFTQGFKHIFDQITWFGTIKHILAHIKRWMVYSYLAAPLLWNYNSGSLCRYVDFQNNVINIFEEDTVTSQQNVLFIFITR